MCGKIDTGLKVEDRDFEKRDQYFNSAGSRVILKGLKYKVGGTFYTFCIELAI